MLIPRTEEIGVNYAPLITSNDIAQSSVWLFRYAYQMNLFERNALSMPLTRVQMIRHQLQECSFDCHGNVLNYSIAYLRDAVTIWQTVLDSTLAGAIPH